MTSVRAPPIHPSECFKPGVLLLEIAVAADCDVIINEIILRLKDPMRVQTFGFDETADVDLSLAENQQWHYGQCIISMDSLLETEEDSFRPVDVAAVAQRIVRRCVVGSKDAYGGHADIGSRGKHFYVIVGGVKPLPTKAANSDVRLSLPSSNATKRSYIPKGGIDIKDLGISIPSKKRTDLIVTDSYSPPMVCIKPGMPVTGNINLNDCLAAVDTLLSLPDILKPQTFTTESTGGVHVPDVHPSKNCFLTIDTNSPLSKSETFSYIKVAYYTSEIIRRCSLGGFVKLTPGEGGFYVSLTGVNPVSMETGLNDLLNITTSGSSCREESVANHNRRGD